MKRGNLVFLVCLVLFVLSLGWVYGAGSWEKVLDVENTNASIIVGFLNESFGIGVGTTGESFITTDQGKTWAQGDNTSMNRYGLEIVDGKTAWSCGDGGQVGTTRDGGKTWQAVSNFNFALVPHHGGASFHCRYLSFITPTTGWIGEPKRLAVTNDAGQTWVPVTLPAGLGEISALSLGSQNDGYLIDATKTGQLYTTKDGGKTWSVLPLNLPGEGYASSTIYTPMTALRFINEKNGVIVSNRTNGQIVAAITADGGKTWSYESVPAVFGSLFLSPDGKYLTITGRTNQIQLWRRK